MGGDLFKTQHGPPPSFNKDVANSSSSLFTNQASSAKPEEKKAGLFANFADSKPSNESQTQQPKPSEDKPKETKTTESQSSMFGGGKLLSSGFSQNAPQGQAQTSQGTPQQGSSGSSLFGNKAENKPAENKPADNKPTENRPLTGGIFGNQPAANQTSGDSQKQGGLFGLTNPTLTKSPSIPNLTGAGGSLLNKSADSKPQENQQSTENKPNSMFGGLGGDNKNQSSSNSGPSIFGNNLSKPSGGGLFGNTMLNTGNAQNGAQNGSQGGNTPSLFGNNAQSSGNTQGGGIFGKLTSGSNTSGGGLFGINQNKN